MSDKRLFSYDPDTKTKTWYVDNPGDGFQLYTEQDVTDIIELNKAKQLDPGYAKLKSKEHGDYWRVASIPNTIQLKWRTEDGIDIYNPDHWPAVKKKLNSNEWRWLKTYDGSI